MERKNDAQEHGYTQIEQGKVIYHSYCSNNKMQSVIVFPIQLFGVLYYKKIEIFKWGKLCDGMLIVVG